MFELIDIFHQDNYVPTEACVSCNIDLEPLQKILNISITVSIPINTNKYYKYEIMILCFYSITA